jgi:hypothetical protein
MDCPAVVEEMGIGVDAATEPERSLLPPRTAYKKSHLVILNAFRPVTDLTEAGVGRVVFQVTP